MKKVKVLLPEDALVNKVHGLVQDLADQRIPARVERNEEENRDYLIITVPGDISDDDLVKLGMFIQERLS